MKIEVAQYSVGQRVQYIGDGSKREEFPWAVDKHGVVTVVPEQGVGVPTYSIEMDPGVRSKFGDATVYAYRYEMIPLLDADEVTGELFLSQNFTPEMWTRVLKAAPKDLLVSRYLTLTNAEKAKKEILLVDDEFERARERHVSLLKIIRAAE